MLLDLIAQSNYNSYNIALANILGLHASIYLNSLININDKAINKKKTTEGFFKIDRNYITHITTLTEAEQKELEKTLIKIGILETDKENPALISLNINVLTSLMMSPDESLVDNIKRLSKVNAPKTKMTQKEATIENLKRFIECDNEELRQAYEDWIEGVYANPNGFLSKKSIAIFQKTVDEFCDRNLDVALKIIEIATVNGYRDATWAINNYKKEYMPRYSFSPSAVSAPVTAAGPITCPQVSVGGDIF